MNKLVVLDIPCTARYLKLNIQCDGIGKFPSFPSLLFGFRFPVSACLGVLIAWVLCVGLLAEPGNMND